MKVLVVGGGGREHALTMALVASPLVDEVHVAPGNAGTSALAQNHPIKADDIDGLLALCSAHDVGLVVVGPEAPLVSGLADRLRELGVPCFGPDAENAMLEGSKLVAKKAMAANGVPTADFQILDADSDIEMALDSYAADPWVVKRDVLAGGKGVVVSSSRDEARQSILDAIENDGEVLLEKFLPGEEASVLVVMDESGFVCLPASQDHKRVGEGDTGLNTGGMGAYAPAPVYDSNVERKTLERIVRPMHEYLSSLVIPYRGVLYVGLMIDSSGDPYVVEFNVRFGDPECQITLPLVESDLASMLYAAAEGRLAEETVSFVDAHCLTVVLAAEGYPGTVVKGRPISLPSSTPSVESGISAWVNHAGTGFEGDTLVSTGGRVLAATGMGSDLASAASAAYRLMDEISLDGSHHRRDIGWRAL